MNADGSAHVAPLGVIVEAPFLVIAPFHPSTTLDNLRRHRFACVNYTTDVRVFAGCVTRRRRDWPVVPAERIARLAAGGCPGPQRGRGGGGASRTSSAHGFAAATVHEASHAPFLGFNRAQAAVLEAAILVSRLHMLPAEKVEGELRYLQIAIDKTAGEAEREAWELADGRRWPRPDRRRAGLAARPRAILGGRLSRRLDRKYLQSQGRKPKTTPGREPRLPPERDWRDQLIDIGCGVEHREVRSAPRHGCAGAARLAPLLDIDDLRHALTVPVF